MAVAQEKIVLDLMDCWRTHDLEGAVSKLAEDAVYTPDLKAASVRGREAIRTLWAGYMERMPSYELEVVNIMSSDTLVMLERVERFRFPEDRPMAINVLPLLGVYEINANGQVAAFRDYWDTSMAEPAKPKL